MLLLLQRKRGEVVSHLTVDEFHISAAQLKQILALFEALDPGLIARQAEAARRTQIAMEEFTRELERSLKEMESGLLAAEELRRFLDRRCSPRVDEAWQPRRSFVPKINPHPTALRRRTPTRRGA